MIDDYEPTWRQIHPSAKPIKKTTYGKNLQGNAKKRGFVMMVRDNAGFRRIVSQFDRSKSIALYSLWDGYRRKPDGKIQEFLDLIGNWKPLHTSGHASIDDVKKLIDAVKPEVVIPMHTEAPETLKSLCTNSNVVVLNDGEEYVVAANRRHCEECEPQSVQGNRG